MEKGTIIIGVSCYYNESAVAKIKNEDILFASQEERLSRVLAPFIYMLF